MEEGDTYPLTPGDFFEGRVYRHVNVWVSLDLLMEILLSIMFDKPNTWSGSGH